jgi:hypothetical protein
MPIVFESAFLFHVVKTLFWIFPAFEPGTVRRLARSREYRVKEEGVNDENGLISTMRSERSRQRLTG